MQVNAVASAGGTLIVSPNANPDVIRVTKAAGLLSFPGVATPTEGFAALDAGADGLLSVEAIAETYWQLHCQHRSAWTLELDLRPWCEKF